MSGDPGHVSYDSAIGEAILSHVLSATSDITVSHHEDGWPKAPNIEIGDPTIDIIAELAKG